MRQALILRAAYARTPLIKFIGKRHFRKACYRRYHVFNLNSLAETSTQESRPHPQAPSSELPSSFEKYRAKAQQHGPLASTKKPVDTPHYSRNSLPVRYRYLYLSPEEMDAIDSVYFLPPAWQNRY